MKIALGTVQFGLQYGVANIHGKVTTEDARKIIELSKSAGINTLDTAIAYGNSEKCLGDVGVNDWNIVTKLPEIPANYPDIPYWIYHQLEASLNRMKVKQVHGLMLHSPLQLLEYDSSMANKVWETLKLIKHNGKARKIGYTVYSPQDLDLLWDEYRPDIVQVPFNILDQRMKKTGWFDLLHNNNIEIHVRSVFLQGLLLMDNKNRPRKFHHWDYIWNNFNEILVNYRISPLEATLGFALNEQVINKVVIGVDNTEQLEEIFSVLDDLKSDYYINDLENLFVDDESLINPSNWGKL